MNHKLILVVIIILTGQAINAQLNIEKLKLYIDCGQMHCDYNYIREQIPVTDFVRDRTESDIHILISSQRAGNGGEKYNVLFFGQNIFSNDNDSIFFISAFNSSPDDVRRQLVKVIQAGIIPYLVKTGNINKINLSFTKDTATSITPEDKWNNWVFSIGGRGRFSGDKNYKEKNIAANGSAARVTEKSKIEFSFYNSTAGNVYTIEENGDRKLLKTTNKYLEAEQEFVKSISAKWSWAIESAFRKSTYNNLQSAGIAAAGIEYNIFPYKLSGSKFFAFRYMLEVTKRSYIEETIYGKLKETLFSANFGAYAYFTQPWGTISSGISWYNYLHDISKNNFSLDANISLKLFKGATINFFGNGSIIKDQLSLAKQGATSQEILLKLKALATTFNYNMGIGINYRFGSKFNNYINPRFTNGRY